MVRLFLDSGVIVDGIILPFAISKVILIACARRFHQLVYASIVQAEVERALLYKHLEGVFSKAEMNCPADDYLRFIKFAKPEIIALPDKSLTELARPMITHATMCRF